MLQIIQMLLADEVLQALVGSHIYPNNTTYLGDCLVYSFHPYYNDKKIRRYRLKITIIAHELTTCDAIENRLAELLLTLGDEMLNWNALQVEQNGGGNLYDDNRHMNHRILYYDILGGL